MVNRRPINCAVVVNWWSCHRPPAPREDEEGRGNGWLHLPLGVVAGDRRASVGGALLVPGSWHHRDSRSRAYAGVPGMTQKGLGSHCGCVESGDLPWTQTALAASSLQSALVLHAIFEVELEQIGWPVSVTKHSPRSVDGIKGQTTFGAPALKQMDWPEQGHESPHSTHCRFWQVCVSPQAAHAAPPGPPQCWKALPGWQVWSAAQQPCGHVSALQAAQTWLMHPCPDRHVAHCSPLAPQAWFVVPGRQAPAASQQPLGQLSASQTH